jgi:large subunit ribosomal protein L29
MKAKDLRERSLEELKELEKTLAGEKFQARLKNFTNRLDNTSLIKKARRDLARVKTLLVQKANAVEGAVKAAPKKKAAKAAPKAAAKPAAAKKPAAKKTAKKKSEA